ncbi:MAG: GNAT family N-acetyltransferase [Pirellulales bacterium]
MIAMTGWRIEVVNGRELDATSIQTWEALRQRNAQLRSPFFACEYTRIMAAERSDVEVGVLLRDGREVGYFPYQRSGSSAVPVGESLTDFQGFIVDADEPISPPEYLRGCRLSTCKFRYLAAGWRELETYRYRRLRSPVIGLARGMASFEESTAARGSDLIPKCTRGLRTLAKKVGPTRMELDCRDALVLERLLEWKALQHQRNGTHDGFGEPESRRILQRLVATHDPTLAGVVSGFYAGEHLVAAALNLRSHETLHVWITAYNPEFSKFSPGLLCMMELVREAAADGVTRIDLGHGDEPYKYRFCTETDEVFEACIARGTVSGWAHHCVYRARQSLLEGRFRPWIQRLKQAGRRVKQQLRGEASSASESSSKPEGASE